MDRLNNRQKGTRLERVAGEFLIKHGVCIDEYNYRCRLGEIDIVCHDDNYLIFTEVKYRKNDSCGESLYAVDLRKQNKIIKVSDFYRLSKGIDFDRPVRYDVIGIDGNTLKWIPGAFLRSS